MADNINFSDNARQLQATAMNRKAETTFHRKITCKAAVLFWARVSVALATILAMLESALLCLASRLCEIGNF